MWSSLQVRATGKHFAHDYACVTMTELWLAPPASGPVHGEVRLPGSKSETNRALILAALSTHPATIIGALDARDTQLMINGLRALGVGFEASEDRSSLRVQPGQLRGPALIDCGLAGTVMRFLPPLAALATGAITFVGDPQARRRPVAATLDVLRAMGVEVAGNQLPFTIAARGSVAGGAVQVDAAASSQFVSGLLLAATRYERTCRLRHRGAPIPSMPHIEMTVAMLRQVGAQVESDTADSTECWWQVDPGPTDLGRHQVEPDLSNAAAFLAAAMVTAGSVTIPRWPSPTTQPGDRIRTIFAEMGARVRFDHEGLTLTGPQLIAGIDLDLHDVGELTPSIAAVCLFADRPSRLRGIGHLRGHETDRLAALASQIELLGGSAIADDDSLWIKPRRLSGADLDTFADHRMATFAAIVGLRVSGVRVHDIAVTTKTMPDFARQWQALVTDSR